MPKITTVQSLHECLTTSLALGLSINMQGAPFEEDEDAQKRQTGQDGRKKSMWGSLRFKRGRFTRYISMYLSYLFYLFYLFIYQSPKKNTTSSAPWTHRSEVRSWGSGRMKAENFTIISWGILWIILLMNWGMKEVRKLNKMFVEIIDDIVWRFELGGGCP